METMVEQSAAHIALEYRWVHKLAHMAENAGLATASEKLHEAQRLLADTRACLDEARDIIERDASRSAAHSIHVQLA